MSINCVEFRTRVGEEWHELLSVVCFGPKFLLLSTCCMFACDLLRPRIQSQNIIGAAMASTSHSKRDNICLGNLFFVIFIN